MAIKYGVASKTARLNALETAAGVAPKFQIRTGAPPTNPGDADSGTLLVEITLPSDWLDDAATAGEVVTKSKLGTWSGTAVANGVAGHFRLKNNAGTVVHQQGTVTADGGGGDATVASTTISSNSTVDVLVYRLTSGN